MAYDDVIKREGTIFGGGHPLSSLMFGEIMADALQAGGLDRIKDPIAYQKAENDYVAQFLRPKRTQEE